MVRGNSKEATRCEVSIKLQEKGLLFWDTIATWTATDIGRRAELDISCELTSGERCRMVTTVTVWSGADSETRTMTPGALDA